MGFEQIVAAAKKQDNRILQAALKLSCIDEFKIGTPYFSAASQFALEGHFAVVEFLIKHGANIDYVALGAAIGGYKAYTEELLRRGASIHWVARGAAIGGHKKYVEELLGRGAFLNFAAMGAAHGGNKEFAEELLRRGAKINHVARGAAIGGYKDYTEELLKRGADIDWVAEGSAIGGHEAYTKELLERGANIMYVANGAARGGHIAYTEELLDLYGVGICWEVEVGAGIGGHKAYAQELIRRFGIIHTVVAGAVIGGHHAYVDDFLEHGASFHLVTNKIVEYGHISMKINRQISCLSFYQPKYIPLLVMRLGELNKNPLIIYSSIEKRAIAVSKNMHQGTLDYCSALVRTAPECQGMLYLLMILVMKKNPQLPNSIAPFPFDIWAKIFSFVTPVTLRRASLEYLGFIVARSYLLAQLSSYQSSSGLHKPRAFSFFQAASLTKNQKEMQDLIAEQTQVLQGNNPYPQNPYPIIEYNKQYKSNRDNNKMDAFHMIIRLWEEMRTGQAVVFMKPEEINRKWGWDNSCQNVVMDENKTSSTKCSIQ